MIAVATAGLDEATAELNTKLTEATMQMKTMIQAAACPQFEMGLAVASAKLGLAGHHIPLFRGLVMDASLVNDPLSVTVMFLVMGKLGLAFW